MADPAKTLAEMWARIVRLEAERDRLREERQTMAYILDVPVEGPAVVQSLGRWFNVIKAWALKEPVELRDRLLQRDRLALDGGDGFATMRSAQNWMAVRELLGAVDRARLPVDAGWRCRVLGRALDVAPEHVADHVEDVVVGHAHGIGVGGVVVPVVERPDEMLDMRAGLGNDVAKCVDDAFWIRIDADMERSKEVVVESVRPSRSFNMDRPHTPDEQRPWWRWHDENPDVVALRDDGQTLEQVTETRDGERVDGWRSRGGWEVWAEPGGFIAHAAALAAYDRAFPPVIDERQYANTEVLHGETCGNGHSYAPWKVGDPVQPCEICGHVPKTEPCGHCHGRYGCIKSVLGLWTVIDNHDRKFRCAVGGGAVVRALLGMPTNDCDLDLFVPQAHVAAVERCLVSAGGVPARFHGSDSERPVYIVPNLGRVDLVGCPSVAMALARFDIRACAVATDGRVLMAAHGALEDLLDRRLHVRRETTRERIAKYLGMGLDLDRGESSPTAEELIGDSDVPGWTNSHLPRGELLGCTMDVEPRVVDLRGKAAS